VALTKAAASTARLLGSPEASPGSDDPRNRRFFASMTVFGAEASSNAAPRPPPNVLL
jgi:hypothetical protein